MSAPGAADTAWQKARMREIWTAGAVVAGWARWHDAFAAMSAGMTTRLVAAARLGPGGRVLDLAAGTGQAIPALAAAVGPTGHVTATDIAGGMVAAMAAGVRRLGLANVTCLPADAHALPFAAGAFDAVVSRLGVMFFPDAGGALGEVRRVLTPGGRAAFLVWGPRERNPFFGTTLGIMARRGLLPPPEPGAPGPFTYEAPGSLAAATRAAGFAGVTEETHELALPWPGPAAEFWRFAREVLPSLGPAYARLTPEGQADLDAAVGAALRAYEAGGRLTLPAVVHVASGATKAED